MTETTSSAQHQLGGLLGDHSVATTYRVILAMRCPRCGAGAGVRCRTGTERVTYPHNARITDAVSMVAYVLRDQPGAGMSVDADELAARYRVWDERCDVNDGRPPGTEDDQ